MLNILRNFAIQTRLRAIVALALLMCLILVALTLTEYRKSILEEKHLKLQQLVQMAKNTLVGLHQAGASDLEVIAAAEKMTFSYQGEENYIWIADLQGNIIYHPMVNTANEQSVKSQAFYKKLIQQANQAGQGFSQYDWPKPGQAHALPKLTYLMTDPNKGWIYAAGIYLDDVEQQIENVILKVIVILVPLTLTMLILSIWITASIKKPLKQTLILLDNIAQGEGDLTQRLPVEGQDELAKFASLFNHFVQRMQALVSQSHVTAGELAQAAEELTRVTQGSQSTLHSQSQQTDQVAVAMHQMSLAIHEIAENSGHAAHIVQNSQALTDQGHQYLQTTLERLQALMQSVTQTRTGIGQLRQAADNIVGILDVIGGVAEQTNLLALNAAIEAARAGEHGRGFAVVADEVRSLAASTQESTGKIQTLIDELLHQVQEADQSMQLSFEQVQATNEDAQQTYQALQEVGQAVKAINEIGVQIATATEEQSATAEEINQNLLKINQLSDHTLSGAQEINQASQDLAQLAETLDASIRRFKY